MNFFFFFWSEHVVVTQPDDGKIGPGGLLCPHLVRFPFTVKGHPSCRWLQFVPCVSLQLGVTINRALNTDVQISVRTCAFAVLGEHPGPLL